MVWSAVVVLIALSCIGETVGFSEQATNNTDGADWVTKGCSFVQDDGAHVDLSGFLCSPERTRKWRLSAGYFPVLDLALQPGMHLLLYGPSYMRQLALPILCYNGRAGQVRMSNSHSTATGNISDTSSSKPTATGNISRTILKHLTATWTYKALNASITLIVNDPTFQDPPNALGEMQALLSAGVFSHAALMQPHPPCYFEWHRNRDKEIVTNPCVNNSDIQPDLPWYHSLVSLFDAAFKSAWVDVTPFPGSIPWSNYAQARKKAKNLRVLNSQDTFDCYGSCKYPDCDHGQAHQCSYTTPSLIAISLMRLLVGKQSEACTA